MPTPDSNPQRNPRRSPSPQTKTPDLTKVSDDELFDAIREQVNLSRGTRDQHDRAKTRAIAQEMARRGWKT